MSTESMPTPGAPPSKPRTWRPMVLWTVALLVALGLSGLVGAAIHYYQQTNQIVKQAMGFLSIGSQNEYRVGAFGHEGQLCTVRDVFDRLGTPEQAAKRLKWYLRITELTPGNDAHLRRFAAIKLLAYCGSHGEEQFVRLLHDRDRDVCIETACILGSFDAVSPATEEALNRVAWDPKQYSEVRQAAIAVLWELTVKKQRRPTSPPPPEPKP